MKLFSAITFAAALIALPANAEDWAAQAQKHTAQLEAFEFGTGETMPITMTYYTLGTPERDAEGKISNAVMLLHGTGGSGTSLLRPLFGDELFGPGQPLDLADTYIISPDNLGHGDSSKPSDGMRLDFPRYDYDDMVRAQYRMLTEDAGVDGLDMIIGTSMGCMHSFVWGPEYPGFVERFVPLACNAIEIAGRNRMFRQMIIDGFEDDPDYDEGNYEDAGDLEMGQLVYANTLILAGGNPYRLQAEAPTKEAAIEALRTSQEGLKARAVDPNDTIYQFDASRSYNPAPRLSEIEVPVLWINSADDFINPPGLGDPEALAAQMANARFVLIPASEETRGHGTHTAAAIWKDELIAFLEEQPD
ncbi:MAG TPA: alpha/beta fold hydrolase [Henriciella marina]|uniref:alpha/beta fold hydrolase n=1 Tax=Henriciella sp. TaxID=1968823 RepID=UPI001791B947|nr:alpha/beta fold hydrolase [Henriciella sp.]HIG21014.1 alpha/beta fold hydrolase [Henriciella sp.]HIK65395.1 alpha/beta fold hydrolase [Henriciella marina]